MNIHPSQDRNIVILERLVMESERMLPEHEHAALLALIETGTPEDLLSFIQNRLPVSDLVAHALAA